MTKACLRRDLRQMDVKAERVFHQIEAIDERV